MNPHLVWPAMLLFGGLAALYGSVLYHWPIHRFGRTWTLGAYLPGPGEAARARQARAVSLHLLLAGIGCGFGAWWVAATGTLPIPPPWLLGAQVAAFGLAGLVLPERAARWLDLGLAAAYVADAARRRHYLRVGSTAGLAAGLAVLAVQAGLWLLP